MNQPRSCDLEAAAGTLEHDRYGIRHVTRFAYDADVSESVMELRMQPASDGAQQCLQFELQVEPRARVFEYRDPLGNAVHHFDLPVRHRRLAITARSLVQLDTPAPLPDALPLDAWRVVDDLAEAGEDWDFLQPSSFAVFSEPLVAFADSLGPVAQRASDPLTTVRQVMAAMHEHSSTRRTRRAWIRPSTRRWRPGAACARTSATSCWPCCGGGGCRAAT